VNAELWATIGTIIGTFVLMIVPGLVYAWVVLDAWSSESPPFGGAEGS
jgi:hypothetical protein